MNTIFITGGTGFIGSFLNRKLIEAGYKLLIASRSDHLGDESISYVNLNKIDDSQLKNIIEQSFAVINLAGENIAGGRWNDQRKISLRNSRLDITQRITNMIIHADNKPECFISASAVGFYGDRGNELLDENSSKGSGFLSDLCYEWENAAQAASCHTRLITPRIGVVLHSSGGALAKMISAYKLYLGGPLGNGQQYMPWVHVDDICNMFLFVLSNKNANGVYNFASDNPVTMNEFSRLLGNQLNRPSFMRVPKFALQILLGESASMVLDSQRVAAKKIIDEGFEFGFDNLEKALADIFR